MASGVVEWVLKLVNGVSAPAAAATTSAKALGAAAGDGATKFDKLGAAMGPLGGILSRISPEAGAAASSIAGLTGALKGGAEGLGVGMGSMGVALGGVVAVVGVLAFAYQGLTARSREAAAVTAIFADGMKGLAESADATTRALLVATIAGSNMSESQGRLALATYDAGLAFDKATDASQKLITANSKILATAGPSIAAIDSWTTLGGGLSMVFGDWADAIDRVDGGLVSLAESAAVNQGVFAFFTSGMDGMTTSTKELEEQSGAAMGAIIQQRAAMVLGVAATEASKVALDKKAAAEKAAAESARQHKAEADALTKSIEDQTAAYEKWLAEYNRGKVDAAGMAAAKAGADYLKRRAAGVEYDKQSAIDAEDYVFQHKQAQEKWLQDYAAQREQERLDAQARAMDTLGAAGSAGGVTSAIGNSGPIGAIIIGVMTAVTNLDETLSGLGDFVADFRKSLKDAPKEFADFLVKELGRGDKMIGAVIGFVQGLIDNAPRIMSALAGSVGELTGALIEGLVEGVPQLVGSLLSSLFDPQTWIKAGEALVQGFVDGFAGVGDATPTEAANNASAKESMDQWGGVKGSHADGADYVDRTGLYVVHRGERIDTASRTQRESGGATSAGGGSGRMIGRGGKVYIEIDADSLSDTFGGLRGRGYAL